MHAYTGATHAHDKGHYNSMFAVHVLTFMLSVNLPNYYLRCVLPSELSIQYQF